MNRALIFTTVFAALMVSMSNCGQPESGSRKNNSTKDAIRTEKTIATDSVAIIQEFEKLKAEKRFLKELGLENEKHYSWNDDFKKIIPGDLDGDGIADALLALVIEGRGGGNNSDIHYAAFLKKENNWIYQNQFDANAGSPDLFYGFTAIKNGIIRGAIMDNYDDAYEVPVEFIFKNKEFINTYTALHKTDNEEREYLKIENIITPTGKIMPPTGTLQTYEQALGKGKFSTPKQQPECGTYFEEGTYSEWLYEHNLRLELSDNKKAAWRSLFMRGTDYKVNTDKGTITANTTVEELKNIFFKEDSWKIADGENGGKVFLIPDAPESDNQLQISFNSEGKLLSVYLFIPC